MSLREALGLNRAAVAVLAVIGCLGLAEEVWSNFLALHLQAQSGAAQAGNTAAAVIEAAFYMGVIASLKNLLEGVGYIAGGSVAHRMGPRPSDVTAPRGCSSTSPPTSHRSALPYPWRPPDRW